jgi:hypothetical protein
MTSDSEMIARSPTPPEPDDDGEEWPVHGIVGEDIDVFGNSMYAQPISFTSNLLNSSRCPAMRQVFGLFC